MSFNFTTYGHWDIYWDKAFVSFKGRFMTEGGPSVILPTKCPKATCSKGAIKTLALSEQHVQS